MFAATKFPTTTPKRLRREKTTLSSHSDSDREPVHVYCRLRPILDDTVESSMNLVSPQELTLALEGKGGTKEVCYKFRHIFTSFSSQKEVFDHVAYSLLEDLLKGKNGLLFAYGVTGSGKTYTVTGNQNNPGIMPRCINTIFNSIEGCQSPKFIIKPDKMNGFEIQSEDEASRDRLAEIRTFNRTPKTPRKNNAEKLCFNNDGVKIPLLNDDNLFAVFVSYVEIYNTNVYDLLDVSNVEQNKILREDCQKNMYVNGVTEVEVKSAQEAFELLSIGKRRKKVAQTVLNAESSRSHSIFNIRVVQLEKEAVSEDGTPVIPEKNMIQVGQLSLVDLAGSERSTRTQNTGKRLKEASCINNSLMCLRTCFETLRENQRTKACKMVPYRDSRLTYLFKSYFEGKGSLQMVVCVNPSHKDFEENLHVLKFAEMTQDVKMPKSEINYTPLGVKKTITKRKATPAKIKATHMSLPLPDLLAFRFTANDVECGANIEKLITSLRQARVRGFNTGEEMEKAHLEFRRRLVKVHQESSLCKIEVTSQKQINTKQLYKIQNLEGKILDLETVNDSLAAKNGELQGVIKSLHHTLKEKDLKLNQNMIERQRSKQKAALNAEKMNQELCDKLKKQRLHLNAVMKGKDIQLKKVKEALEQEVQVQLEDVEVNENIAPSTAKSSASGQTPRRNLASTTPRNRRRSRSAGEQWLEHNTIKPVALDTLMQPTMRKRKSVSKLVKAADVTNPKQSKYCLVAQEPDTEGEVETKLYKGDILPTCGGGAQVIFNDVERLRQESPTASPARM